MHSPADGGAGATCSFCGPDPSATGNEAGTESGQPAGEGSSEEEPSDEGSEPLADEEAEAASDPEAEPASGEGSSTDDEPASFDARVASSAGGGARTISGGNNDSGSAAASQPASEPEHQHSWQAMTEQKWVEDSAAWDEPVYTQQAQYVCAGCGAVLSGDPYSHFTRSGCVNGSKASNYREVWNQVQTGTVHHDATGHYETVTTGYRCSGCGATK